MVAIPTSIERLVHIKAVAVVDGLDHLVGCEQLGVGMVHFLDAVLYLLRAHLIHQNALHVVILHRRAEKHELVLIHIHSLEYANILTILFALLAAFEIRVLHERRGPSSGEILIRAAASMSFMLDESLEILAFTLFRLGIATHLYYYNLLFKMSQINKIFAKDRKPPPTHIPSNNFCLDPRVDSKYLTQNILSYAFLKESGY